MSMEVKIPAVGESVSSGIISVWHKDNGAQVKTGDVLLTLETDKVSTEITSEADGSLDIQVEEGSEVQVGQVVALINEVEQSEPQQPTAPESRDEANVDEPRQSQPEGEGSTEIAEPKEEEPQPAVEDGNTGEDQETEQDDRQRHGPAVARILEEQAVKPEQVEQRSGPGNRITKEDLLNYLKQREESGRSTQAVSGEQESEQSNELATASRDELAATPAAKSEAEAITTRRKMSPLRRKIAQQLVNVQRETALLTTFNECDMSAVITIRKRMQESFQERHGIKLGFMSFFIKAVVNALQEVPGINARIDGDDLVQNHYYDIGVAVSTNRGLIVPVIRGANDKSFAALEKELSEFAEKARDSKIQIEELQGGVFTISNGGIYGSLLSTPILNPPQSGILGMHAIKERPVVVDGEIVARPMMNLALSYDHRVVDGREAVSFLVCVKEAIEDPMQLIL